MIHDPQSIPENERVYSGPEEVRYLALVVETLVHDASPVGDDDVARQLGAYTVGEGPPPEAAPEYVTLDDERLILSNPPFLLGEFELAHENGYVLRGALDSELQLLIDSPVEVRLEGTFEDVAGGFEQMLAEIYRTRGRRLESIDAGVVDGEEFVRRYAERDR